MFKNGWHSAYLTNISKEVWVDRRDVGPKSYQDKGNYTELQRVEAGNIKGDQTCTHG